MNYTENEILKFSNPVLKFCIKRLTSYHDAEDLSSKIILYVWMDLINMILPILRDGFGKLLITVMPDS